MKTAHGVLSLAYGFWGEDPDDRPDIDDLIKAVGRTPS